MFWDCCYITLMVLLLGTAGATRVPDVWKPCPGVQISAMHDNHHVVIGYALNWDMNPEHGRCLLRDGYPKLLAQAQSDLQRSQGPARAVAAERVRSVEDGMRTLSQVLTMMPEHPRRPAAPLAASTR